MSRVTRIGHAAWTAIPRDLPPGGAANALESGDVLFVPALEFEIRPSEEALFSPAIVTAAKNISFDPGSGSLKGTALDGSDLTRLLDLVSRFSDLATGFIGQLLPEYRDRIERGRTSFRPVEIAGRASSWRKDDTRLHVDSFTATPVHGRRILRVFTNVNPHGRPRAWRIGEDFEGVAGRFAPALRLPWPGSGTLLRLLGLTKSRRSPYDALMLQLHDRMKADTDYQARAPQTEVQFPAGSTWIAFTDQVSHAAMAGQYQLEQTFLVPVAAMIDDRRSPLRVLERLVGRRLL
jgi:3-deoxy-D-manno-oct-2-ulosonic acid (Kdo) hydroxylase